MSLLAIYHILHQYRFGWFPLMYFSAGEAKVGGLLFIGYIVLAIDELRWYGVRSWQFRNRIESAALTLGVACVLYFLSEGPAWLLFAAGAVCLAQVVNNLWGWVRSLLRGRIVNLFGYLAATSAYIIMLTACFWYAAKVVGQSAAWMQALVDLDDDFAWIGTVALGACLFLGWIRVLVDSQHDLPTRPLRVLVIVPDAAE